MLSDIKKGKKLDFGAPQAKKWCFRSFLYENLHVSVYRPFWEFWKIFVKKSVYRPVDIPMHPCSDQRSRINHFWTLRSNLEVGDFVDVNPGGTNARDNNHTGSKFTSQSSQRPNQKPGVQNPISAANDLENIILHGMEIGTDSETRYGPIDWWKEERSGADPIQFFFKSIVQGITKI